MAPISAGTNAAGTSPPDLDTPSPPPAGTLADGSTNQAYLDLPGDPQLPSSRRSSLS